MAAGSAICPTDCWLPIGKPQPARAPKGRAPEGAFAARPATACGKPAECAAPLLTAKTTLMFQ
jgi:hypothetical protein